MVVMRIRLLYNPYVKVRITGKTAMPKTEVRMKDIM